MKSKRCDWCGDDPQYVAYHDDEWGRPEVDSQKLFEKLILDGFQAGLAWITILRKREGFREAFDFFDPHKIASYDERKIESLLENAGIVRHRGKIEATVGNAQAWLKIEEREGFEHFLWKYFEFTPLVNRFKSLDQVPAQTPLSQQISKALKAEGFKFCGPTIVYAFAQAVGMVNDHLLRCPAHAECQAEGEEIRF